MLRKIHFVEYSWKHHRSGWKPAIRELRRLRNGMGMICDLYADNWYETNPHKEYHEPWIGFLHHTITYPSTEKSNREPLSYLSFALEDYLRTDLWEKNYPWCRGILTLSENTKSYLQSRLDVPISSVLLPGETPDVLFSYEKFINSNPRIVVFTGSWMRRFESIYLLNTSNKYKKCLLECIGSFNAEIIQQRVGQQYETVTKISSLSNDDYDKLLETAIVFLDLYDVAACNGVVDCIMRNTPLLINKLPGAIEYLGESYPFYYETLEEATAKLSDDLLIEQTTEYLKKLKTKSKLTLNYFVRSVYESEVYQKISEPAGVIENFITYL